MRCKDLLSFDSKYTKYVLKKRNGDIEIIQFLGTDRVLYRFHVLASVKFISYNETVAEAYSLCIMYLPENTEIIPIE